MTINMAYDVIDREGRFAHIDGVIENGFVKVIREWSQPYTHIAMFRAVVVYQEVA